MTADGSAPDVSEAASADAIPDGGRQYHLALEDGDVAPSVLLPGDPDRVSVIAEEWDHAEPIARHREYRTITGEVDGVPISTTSTGIGSPSASIAIEELARLGADTFIRVGSCGALQPEIEIGDLVITRGAVRQEGTSEEYVRPTYPAAADERVVGALVAAAERHDHPYHVGVTMSADSFYAGQARESFGGFTQSSQADLLADLRAANVLNIEMEASSILTLANLFGLRAGAICTVYANRSTGEFQTADQRPAAAVASTAVTILADMDDRVSASDADRWYPGLGLSSE